MKVLIVEDEKAAYENLKAILNEINDDIEIVGYTQSVSQTVGWLKTNPAPDLVFMDIRLSDDNAFAIFNQTELDTPVIFTTAYDDYAIEAFRVNSIDYLLKPLKKEDVKRSVNKFIHLNTSELRQYQLQLETFAQQKRYSSTLLVQIKDKFIPVQVNNIVFIYSTSKNTKVSLTDGKELALNKTLDKLMEGLDPQTFFRANKQFIINRNQVKEITVWFDSRLLVTMSRPTPEHIYVSKNKATEFKQWMSL